MSNENLLALLNSKGNNAAVDPWTALDATRPMHDRPKAPEKDAKLDELLNRINGIKGGEQLAEETTEAVESNNAAVAVDGAFLPVEPKSFTEAQLTASEVESLMLKLLLARGDASGRLMSDHLKLPFALLSELLRQLKQEQWVVLKGDAPMNDYLYTLTDLGRERARRLSEHCTYFGAAPVSLRDYIASVAAQSLTAQHPTVEDLRRAFSDLLINQTMLRRLGPAINSARGLFLYARAR